MIINESIEKDKWMKQKLKEIRIASSDLDFSVIRIFLPLQRTGIWPSRLRKGSCLQPPPSTISMLWLVCHSSRGVALDLKVCHPSPHCYHCYIITAWACGVMRDWIWIHVATVALCIFVLLQLLSTSPHGQLMASRPTSYNFWFSSKSESLFD
jgi:hypothetical protein